MVLSSWNRALLLEVVPPPAITPRVMSNRALLWAKAVPERQISRSRILIGTKFNIFLRQ
jgi:hypothetical protein